MYTRATSSSTFLSPDFPPPVHPFPDELALTELESLLNCNNSEIISFNKSSSSGSYNSEQGSVMQRSVSSHSLHKNPFSALLAELFDDDAPLRRVCSTGDLHGTHGGIMHNNNESADSPLSSESSMIIEGMSRACRYSPEEKKLRIERYRTKRNQRNFNKKIKYVCRKTLADSRPRIRGRFARNDEIDKNPSSVHQWNHHIGAGAEEDEEDQNWVSIFDSLVAANTDQESQDSSSFGLLY
ncbi:zinc finger protein CONSTANS-like [Arachis stenosperma]|uniref:zinc finger protein CONSTANS-like n=1 Tax=Arachis stenosperma TaxID=217475 RepID=UPI0025ACA96D|nr:zinc finger protein CONSTANS-like [Arachis stenosperma]